MPKTLAFRLTLWYTLIFLVSSMALFGVVYYTLSTVMDSRISEDLQEDIVEYRQLLAQSGMAVLRQELNQEVAIGDDKNVFLRLVDNQGQQLFATNLSHWPSIESDKDIMTQLMLSSENPTVIRTRVYPGHDYATQEIYGRVGEDTVLHIGESMEEKTELLETLQSIYAAMLLFVLPLASFVGWFMSHKAVKGVEEVSRIAATIERGQLDVRVNVSVSDREIQTLATTFNAMLDRIAELVTSMRDMTDNIAHDMRSPLARIRVIAESALMHSQSPEQYKATAADTIEECDRLLKMVNTTLDVAEVEAGAANLTQAEINVAQLVTEACELFEPVAEQKNIKFSWQADLTVFIRGNAHYLQRMLGNLVENALKYTPKFGKVNVAIAHESDHVAITVSDTGIGIAAQDLPRIFERFFRCDDSRSEEGCGLGLSFSRAVVRAHGGDIKVTSLPNVGTTFTVQIPN